MRDCPNCGAAVDGLVCAACGHGKKAENGGRVLPSRHWKEHWPEEWNCCHVERGQRCANPGAFSESVKGGGPFCCKQHYPPFARRNYGPAALPPKGWQSVHDALRTREPGEEG